MSLAVAAFPATSVTVAVTLSGAVGQAGEMAVVLEAAVGFHRRRDGHGRRYRSASLTTSVTVRPGSIPVVVPADRRGRGIGRIDVRQTYGDAGARIQHGRVVRHRAGLLAASVTDAVTPSGPSVKPDKSAVAL